MEVTVRRAGMLTTVQDLGRRGHRAAGVPLSGAMDPYALRLANLLVGNPENAAALEFTLVGPELEFSADTIIALGGGDFGTLPLWQPFPVGAGARLKFGHAQSGCRGYLAIAGGLAVAPVLGSRSTYLRGGLGGFGGRLLRNGDVLPVADARRRVVGHWHIDPRVLPEPAAEAVARVVRGAQGGEFGEEFFSEKFTVTSQSDRMGVRLGGAPIRRRTGGELLSSTVAPGTIQIPPDGHPIVLMADAQTIGGYPKIAHVIAVDLPVVAQLRPGGTLRFCEVTLAEARELAQAQERTLAVLREGLQQKVN